MGVSAVIDDVRAGFIADACPTIELTTAEHLNAAVRVETRIHPFQRDADLTRLRAMAATLGAEDRWRHIERLRRAAARAVEQDLVLVAEDQAGAGPFLVPHGGRLEGEAPTAHHVESARKVRRRAPKKQRAVLGADLRDGAAVDFEVDDLLIGQHRVPAALSPSPNMSRRSKADRCRAARTGRTSPAPRSWPPLLPRRCADGSPGAFPESRTVWKNEEDRHSATDRRARAIARSPLGNSCRAMRRSDALPMRSDGQAQSALGIASARLK